VATAVIYTTLGAVGVRRTRLGIAIVAHAGVAAAAWAIAGRAHGLAGMRLVLAAEAVGCAGVGLVARWICRDAALAAAIGVLAALVALFALPLVEGVAPSRRARTIAAAASPILAAADAIDVDLLRLRSVYARSPSAVREMGETSFGWTCLAWAIPGVAQFRSRRSMDHEES
jgi:hypothetical protein